jgi:hypothetical protein
MGVYGKSYAKKMACQKNMINHRSGKTKYYNYEKNKMYL